MPDGKKRITDYPTASEIGSGDYVMIDNGGANGTKKFLASELGGYAETTLWYDANGVYSGNVTLDYAYINYDVILIKCGSLSETNVVWFASLPVSEISDDISSISIGTRIPGADVDVAIIIVDSTTFTISSNNNANLVFKIIGVKY